MTRNTLFALLASGALTVAAVANLDRIKAISVSDGADQVDGKCLSIASQDQADKLLKRLFPGAKLLTAEELSLDNTKSTCLLEVEMLVDEQKPDTRGFVYVLPDGERFLNGPLMDKRSQVSTTPQQGDIDAALKEQQERLMAIFSQGREASTQPQPVSPPEAPTQNLAIQPTSQESIPTPDQLREKLLTQLQTLPTIVTQAEGTPVYVLIDPTCAHCKKLFSSSASLAEKHGIQFRWIPMFINEGGWALSALLLKTQKADPEKASEMLGQIMTGKWDTQAGVEAIKALTETDYAGPKAATSVFLELAKYNSQIGTPLVVFRKASGAIEVISGYPRQDDWAGLASGI